MKNFHTPALVVLIALAVPGAAHAATGTATGRIMHFNRQGNYCPTTRDCTGSKYPQSQWNTAQPIRHVKVYVRDGSDAIIGQGSTDVSGNFTITWSSPALPAQLHITWHGEHKDGRFVIQDANGATWVFWTYPLATVSGGTTAFGSMTWGAPGAPHDITNIYDGAHREWWDSLWWSSRQQATYFGIRIYTGSTRCPTSCEESDQVWLDPGAAYAPQARVMHEMGHAASQHAHEGSGYWPMSDYCYPGTGGCSWSLDEPEWRQSGLEEATATFFADAGLYAANALQPHSCYASQLPCGTSFYNLETSSGPPAVCAVDEGRRPVTIMRILWDLYDTHVDCAGGFCDTVSASLDQLTNVFTAFPNGRGDGQKNEGWGCFIIEERWSCWPDNRDARNIYDYAGHFLGVTGVSAASVLTANCN